jgi:hypothetical protein
MTYWRSAMGELKHNILLDGLKGEAYLGQRGERRISLRLIFEDVITSLRQQKYRVNWPLIQCGPIHVGRAFCLYPLLVPLRCVCVRNAVVAFLDCACAVFGLSISVAD